MWNTEEKARFEEAVDLYGADWLKVTNHIGDTKSVEQVISRRNMLVHNNTQPHNAALREKLKSLPRVRPSHKERSKWSEEEHD